MILPPLVSVIFGTYNRLTLLQDAVASIRSSIGPYSYEIVITDGGSTDGSLQWMADQPDIVIAETGNLKGAVSAFNAAWSASRGKLIANFNDDAKYLEDCLAQGVSALRDHENIGQVAFEFDLGGWWHFDRIRTLAYANFGMSPREVVEKVCVAQGGPKNYWSPLYHTYAADCEHSAWIWNLGYQVLALEGARVHDCGVEDGLRGRNARVRVARGDSLVFGSRWPSREKILEPKS